MSQHHKSEDEKAAETAAKITEAQAKEAEKAALERDKEITEKQAEAEYKRLAEEEKKHLDALAKISRERNTITARLTGERSCDALDDLPAGEGKK